MKTRLELENRSLMQFKKRGGGGAAALLLLLPWAAIGGGVVTNCAEANLRAALAGGGMVTFACDGIITLTSTITNEANTTLDASGHHITISGANTVRLFYVNTNVTFTVVNLTLADGAGTFGGGIYNDGGTVELVASCLQANTASAEPWSPASGLYGRGGNGGGIFNRGGTVGATNSSFLNNWARQGSTPVAVEWGGAPPVPTGPCLGGAIDSEGGRLNLHNCVFRGNRASGGAGVIWTRNGSPIGVDNGRNAEGGAIYNSGLLKAVLCTFTGNLACGGLAPAQTALNPTYPGTGLTGTSGGTAAGGAVGNAGALSIEKSLFASNGVSGGPGGAGGPGWSGSGLPPAVSDGGVGGTGGGGSGGPLFNRGTASLVNCTFAWNTGIGGVGGDGGRGGTWSAPNLYGGGGAGGNGGSGMGGVFSATALTNSTVAFNSGNGGAGGAGGAPGGPGPSAGPPGTNGPAGGGINGGTLLNTLLASNAPANCTGSAIDGGHNLSSDATPVLYGPGSLGQTEPMLGPLANNGGTTLTMALLPGSPAIDAGDNAAAPPTDQRGIPRPVGLFSDIGAYEFTAVLQIIQIQAHKVDILAYGPSGQLCELLTGTTLSDWRSVARKTFGPDGTVLFEHHHSTDEPHQFYKVALP